jgi:hypothetical protein
MHADGFLDSTESGQTKSTLPDIPEKRNVPDRTNSFTEKCSLWLYPHTPNTFILRGSAGKTTLKRIFISTSGSQCLSLEMKAKLWQGEGKILMKRSIPRGAESCDLYP